MTTGGGSAQQTRTPVIALVGNPNTGKTSLFNALTGFRRMVANYPGVTVEVGRGPIRGARQPLDLLDLPGTYSLAANSPDELLVSRVLCGHVSEHGRPDLILVVADASNLRRNLYLVSQLLEVGLPVVVALNMVDVAEGRGLTVDTDKLARALGTPVVPIVATRRRTIPPLLAALDASVGCSPPRTPTSLPAVLATEAEQLGGAGHAPLAERIRLLLDAGGSHERHFLSEGGPAGLLEEARSRLSAAGVDAAAEIRARYAWIDDVLTGVIRRPAQPPVTWSERIDRVLTHRVGGALVLLAVLFIVFQSIFATAAPLADLIDTTFGRLGRLVTTVLPESALRSMLSDAVIGGVGAVVAFLPQILILFALIAILEDCGYMARAAFMMDRLMRTLGLSGRAFIPLLSSFACAVPAILGTRTIADRRERYVTILIAPFMSCSARLPIYVLMTAAFVKPTRYLGGWVGLPGLVIFAMYLVGALVSIPLAWALRKTVFGGPPPGFLLELPSYKLPRLGAIWQRVHLSGRSFLARAGTVILLVNVLAWALGYFPHDRRTRAAVVQEAQAQGWPRPQVEAAVAGAYLRESYLGRAGRAIEPVIAPIGWDWRIGVAVLSSFPAREVVVGTLGTITSLSAQQDRADESLQNALRELRWADTGRPVFTLPVALSVMVFFALCAQCSSTLVMIGREMKSWTWPVIVFVGMTTIAYFAAWGTSAAGRALGL